jgi:hypothetical protein
MIDNERIPAVAVYRGIEVHDCQSVERIERVIKPEIDLVYDTAYIERLAEIAADPGFSPESRLLSAAKCQAAWEVAATERRQRPSIRLDRIVAWCLDYPVSFGDRQPISPVTFVTYPAQCRASSR